MDERREAIFTGHADVLHKEYSNIPIDPMPYLIMSTMTGDLAFFPGLVCQQYGE